MASSERPDISIRRDKGGHIVVSLPAYLEGGESMPSLEEAVRHAKALKQLLRLAAKEKEVTGRVSVEMWAAIDGTLDNMIEALPPTERSYDVRGG